MGNIQNYTLSKLDFKLSNSDYWDFYLNTDTIQDSDYHETNLIASFDFSSYGGFGVDFIEPDFLEGDFNMVKVGIISDVEWEDAFSTDFSATTFGLTGMDNGLIPYDGNTDLLTVLTGTTLVHTSTNTKLVLNQVSGATGGYVYPSEITLSGELSGNYMTLRGGFLQGYYKLAGYDYQVLPTRYQKGFSISTWLRPSDYATTGTTLNDTYSGNTGFFYYTGTRAENKFWNIFSGVTASACTSGDTFCTDIKETDVIINNIFVDGEVTDESVPLSPPPIDVSLIENNFLIFGRSNGKVCGNGESEDGFGQVRADNSYDKDNKYYANIVRQEQTDFQNQFLTFGRSNGKVCGNGDSEDGFGQTRAGDYSGSTQDVMELDKDADIIDNAIGFRIKEDGSIGYRLLTISGDCKSVEVVEEYSMSGMVTTDQWQHIVVKWVNNDTYSECDLVTEGPRKGKYKFYVDANLVFVSKTLEEFIPKSLYDIQEKQIAVPFNISVGGGTQGLIESITFDGQDPDDLGLIIEQNFAGTFIGDILSFDMYDKNLSWCEIKDIFNSKLI